MQNWFILFCSQITFSRVSTRQAPDHAVQQLKMSAPLQPGIPQQQSQQKVKADQGSLAA